MRAVVMSGGGTAREEPSLLQTLNEQEHCRCGGRNMQSTAMHDRFHRETCEFFSNQASHEILRLFSKISLEWRGCIKRWRWIKLRFLPPQLEKVEWLPLSLLV